MKIHVRIIRYTITSISQTHLFGHFNYDISRGDSIQYTVVLFVKLRAYCITKSSLGYVDYNPYDHVYQMNTLIINLSRDVILFIWKI